MNCFETAPEFVDEDNRRFRTWNPVSKSQMHAKHSALLPEQLINGKTILDLGCCLGATGHWCLSQGAAHYTGVEVQKEYTDIAEPLFARYHAGKYAIHHMSIEEWLAQPQIQRFDIVCLLGVIFAFTDYYSVLKKCAAQAREVLAIESIYPERIPDVQNFCGVEFQDDQAVNLGSSNSSVIGRGTRLSPKGLDWIMRDFGFTSDEGVILPPPVFDIPDIYNRPLNKGQPVRYLMRFTKTQDVMKNLSEDLQQGSGKTKPWKKT